MLNHLNLGDSQQRRIILAAALLHDIGHSFSSHTMELLTHIPHEEYSKKFIREKTNIHRILLENNVDPEAVCQIIDHNHPTE
jgi:HD superfamily phosphohydrolase